MNNFTGRRSTGTAKKIGRGLLDGLSALGTALADGPKLQRIHEIDSEIAELQQERDHLVMGLTQDYGEKYQASENYDPSWRKEVTSSSATVGDGIPRLTSCRGSLTDHDPLNDVHPGCPYKGTAHRSHEFTLRD